MNDDCSRRWSTVAVGSIVFCVYVVGFPLVLCAVVIRRRRALFFLRRRLSEEYFEWARKRESGGLSERPRRHRYKDGSNALTRRLKFLQPLRVTYAGQSALLGILPYALAFGRVFLFRIC